MNIENSVKERFLRYVKIDTQSDDSSQTNPSTQKQFVLANILVEELHKLGILNAKVNEKCYVTATLEANTNQKLPAIGFIAHLDTSPDMSGENVCPQIVENYDGGNIILDQENEVVLSPTDFPELLLYVNQAIITTNGKTLLGADDKAGVAEIMTVLEVLCNNSSIKHGKICICFTPDEEIGQGADFFDVAAFGADYAYTLDGGRLGELEYENFNAAQAQISVQGRNVHPGTALSTMVNAIEIAMEFHNLLPIIQKPQFTTAYEGFFHLHTFNGTVENAEIHYIIRDHDMNLFETKKHFITEAVAFINKKYGKNLVKADIKNQYFNMKEKIEDVFFIVENAKKAMQMANVEPIIQPIRGGTDGARLSFMGLPTPNIFTGGHNYHGKYEFIPIPSMVKAVEVVLNIIKIVQLT